MIMGSGPTQQNPIDFTPPTVGGGNIFALPKTGFYSHLWPFNPAMGRQHAYPAYQPAARGGPVAMPSIMPPPSPAAAMAPAPGPLPGGTHGAFGGSGFGSSGGVRAHSHVDPYMVMRQGVIPGVSPNGSNIRAGVQNAGARVDASMPYQSAALPAAMPMAPAPMPTNTHGFGGFSWNPVHWFSKPRPMAPLTPGAATWMRSGAATHPVDAMADAKRQHAALAAQGCETVGPRLDGSLITICNGRVIAISDGNGTFRRVG